MNQQARSSDAALADREHRLTELLTGFGSVCIGFSGGVDSVYLAVAALGVLGPDKVLAVTGRSAAYPQVQRAQAHDCVRRFNIPHLEIDTYELDDANYAANPSNRCYFCKAELWQHLDRLAAERGYAVVCDGSNADDASDHRPGMKAATERGVRSPLLEAGLTKSDIRVLSRRLGLPTWDAPASPCLASRLPYGVAVTPARLLAVEQAEDALRHAGLREFRVRHHGDVARIETSPAELATAVGRAGALIEAVRGAGFDHVLIDVEGYRRGALNEAAPLVGIGSARRVVAPLEQAGETLARAGIVADVRAAGQHGDILAVAAPPEIVPRLAGLAGQLKSAGYRYIAIDPQPHVAADPM